MVFFALEFRDLAASAGEYQNGFVVPHQFSCAFGRADDAAVGGHQVVTNAAAPPEPAIGQWTHSAADCPTNEVRNQQHLTADKLSVVAHQQESSVGGQCFQAGYMGPKQVDKRRNPVLGPV